MIGIFIIVGALVGCAIDMTFIHNAPVYGGDWLAPVIGGAIGAALAR